MDFTLVAAFVAFFAMILAWVIAPSSVRIPAPVVLETIAVGAD
jgi:hypothetical protein